MKLFYPLIKKDNSINIYDIFHLIFKNIFMIIVYLVTTSLIFVYIVKGNFKELKKISNSYNYTFVNTISNMSQYDSIKFNFVINRILELQEKIGVSIMSSDGSGLSGTSLMEDVSVENLFNAQRMIAESENILTSRTFQYNSLPRDMLDGILVEVSRAPQESKFSNSLNLVSMSFNSDSSLDQEGVDELNQIFDVFIDKHIFQIRDAVQIGLSEILIQLKWNIEKNLIIADKLLNELDSDQLSSINQLREVIQMFNQYRENYIPTLSDLISEYGILDKGFMPLVYDNQVTTIGINKIEVDPNRVNLFQKISVKELLIFFIAFNLLLIILIVVFINNYFLYLYKQKN